MLKCINPFSKKYALQRKIDDIEIPQYTNLLVREFSYVFLLKENFQLIIISVGMQKISITIKTY